MIWSERTDGLTRPASTWLMKPLVSSPPASCAWLIPSSLRAARTRSPSVLGAWTVSGRLATDAPPYGDRSERRSTRPPVDSTQDSEAGAAHNWEDEEMRPIRSRLARALALAFLLTFSLQGSVAFADDPVVDPTVPPPDPAPVVDPAPSADPAPAPTVPEDPGFGGGGLPGLPESPGGPVPTTPEDPGFGG